MNEEVPIESPCNGVCEMNPSTGYCLGCFRTKEEIKGWDAASNAEREAILDQTTARRDELY